MFKNISVARLTRIAVVIAIYVVLTLILQPISYGSVQVRLSEILVLLCFYKIDYCIALTVGCALANMFSPFFMFDVPFGTLATLIAVICMYKSKKLWIAAIFPVIINGLIVGGELYYLYELPYWISAGSVALGELIAVVIIGIPLFEMLKKNKMFMKTLAIDADKKT